MTPSAPPHLRALSSQFRQRPLRRRVIRRALSRRLRIAGLASLLIHIIIGVLLLVTIRLQQRSDLLPPPAAVTMLFDSGRRNGPTEPQPQPNAAPSPSPPAPESPSAVEAPAPPAEQPPPPVPPPVVQTPPPAPPVTPPLPTPPLPAPPLPAPPLPAPPLPAPPLPTPPLPTPPLPAPLPLTAPPPPAQTPEAEPAPPPAPAPRPLPPPVKPAAPVKPPDFPAPMNYSFGKPLSRSPAPSSSRPPGTTSFSLGPAKPGPADDSPYADVDGDNAGPDWRNALSRWVSEHAYYPPQARNQGEQGDVRVHVVAMPNGRVTSVELLGRSGSMWLDLALQALFRDAHIPPLPSGAAQQIEFNFTMHYILIRR